MKRKKEVGWGGGGVKGSIVQLCFNFKEVILKEKGHEASAVDGYSVSYCLTLLLPCPPGHNGLYLQTVSQDKPFPAHSAFIRYFVVTVRKGPNTGRTARVTERTVVGRCSHAHSFVGCQWLLLHHPTKLNSVNRG